MIRKGWGDRRGIQRERERGEGRDIYIERERRNPAEVLPHANFSIYRKNTM
jgi:hypothetical protein